MEDAFYDWIGPLFIMFLFLIFVLRKDVKQFKEKHYKIFTAIKIILIAYFIFDAVQNGHNRSYAFAAIFFVDTIYAYVKRKRST